MLEPITELSTTPQNRVVLKRHCDRRIRLGHRWIFSNEVETTGEGMGQGEVVEVVDARGDFLGWGYFNRQALIAVRLLTRRREERIDTRFFLERLEAARLLRERLFPGSTAYRLVYSEGDALPGLVIDRYGQAFVLQFHTLGMERLRAPLLEALEELFQPQQMILRNDLPVRELEGLPQEKGRLKGDGPDLVEIEEGGHRFMVDLWEGQKTGFFFDQRENRARVGDYAQGRRVLDCFCYTGAWAISAAKAGAQEVLGIDSSAGALELARTNALLNGVQDRCRFQEGEVFQRLRALLGQGERFSLVILDPPAFAKRKKDVLQALKGYRDLNALALSLLDPGGILMSSSCSHHVSPEEFLRMLVHAVFRAKREVKLLELRGQARDHPVLPAMRETAYLKCAILEVGAR